MDYIWLLTLWINFHLSCCYLDEPGSCEPIRVAMCSHLKYNLTRMPNFLGHQTQQEAIEELRPYAPLADALNCSVHLKFLLCSLFVPMCTRQMDGPLVIEVCRSMCLKVKADCEPVLSRVSVRWPLNCSLLPEVSTKEKLCMAPEDVQTLDPQPVRHVPQRSDALTAVPDAVVSISTARPQSCPANYIKVVESSCDDLCNPECSNCVPKCEDVYYTQDHKRFAYAWIAIWSSLCVVSSLLTIFTFCVEPGRFRYPTRPVIFMAFCYLMYSLAFFIRLFVPASDIICKTNEESSWQLVYDGMESTLCVIVFLIQYYFGMASHIWWLVLTLTWYLAASRKWGLEAINCIACYFHLLAWALPAVLTIAILVTGKVDTDELTGMCYVGNHDKWALVSYVIIPVCILLITGEVFLLAGFGALFRIRSNLKNTVDNANIRKLEKLMAKIGVFSILYTVPTICVLGSYIHEAINMDTWRCLSKRAGGSSTEQKLTQSIPTVEIHMLQTFMGLIIGITIAMWVLSSKTVKSCEQNLCRRQRLSTAHKQPVYMSAHCSGGTGLVQSYTFATRPTVVGSSHQQFTQEPNIHRIN